MCVVKSVVHFVKNGAKVLHDASRGEYREESDAITRMKEELFVDSSAMNDKAKLNQDRKAVGEDVRRAWNKLTMNNG